MDFLENVEALKSEIKKELEKDIEIERLKVIYLILLGESGVVI